MVQVMEQLAKETVATCAYHQSDEITLCWTSNPYFDGRLSKMTSVLASMATHYFTYFSIRNLLDFNTKGPAFFDCRVWAVPSLNEAANVFVWRELDATRNSIQMAGQHCFSHKQLHGKSNKEIQEMLFSEYEINWDSFPPFFKRGTYCRRRTVTRAYTFEEISKLPKNHDAKTNPDLQVARTEYVIRPLEYHITSVVNKVDTLFFGQVPRSKEEAE